MQANKCNILAAQHDAEPAVGSKLLRLPAIQQMWSPVRPVLTVLLLLSVLNMLSVGLLCLSCSQCAHYAHCAISHFALPCLDL